MTGVSSSSIATGAFDCDREAIVHTLSGDIEMFGGLVRRYERQAYAVARAILPAHQDVEDAVQEAFVQAYQKLHTFDQNLPFCPWLYRIVINKARDIARKNKVRQADEISDAVLGTMVHDVWEFHSLDATLSQAISHLPTRQRLIVTMYFQGFSHAEIAASLGIASGTSRADLHSARYQLQRMLEDVAA